MELITWDTDFPNPNVVLTDNNKRCDLGEVDGSCKLSKGVFIGNSWYIEFILHDNRYLMFLGIVADKIDPVANWGQHYGLERIYGSNILQKFARVGFSIPSNGYNPGSYYIYEDETLYRGSSNDRPSTGDIISLLWNTVNRELILWINGTQANSITYPNDLFPENTLMYPAIGAHMGRGDVTILSSDSEFTYNPPNGFIAYSTSNIVKVNSINYNIINN